MQKQTLEPIYTKRAGKLFIALRSPARNAIVAIGKFPDNCPREAISRWIRSKNEEYLMVA